MTVGNQVRLRTDHPEVPRFNANSDGHGHGRGGGGEEISRRDGARQGAQQEELQVRIFFIGPTV